MAMFWAADCKVLNVLSTTSTIEMHILDEEKGEDSWVIGIYASCDDKIRKMQWDVVNRRKRLWGSKWIIAGDFNYSLKPRKVGGRIRSQGSMEAFNQFINHNLLIGLGFERAPWTW